MTNGIVAFSGASHFFVLASLLVFLCTSAQAQRKDDVVMDNGDHFTGSVKRLQNGLLYIETKYAPTDISVDWNQVQSVESSGTYQIILNNGHRMEGRIEKKPGGKAEIEDFLIREATEEVQVPSVEVASIESTKLTFWRHLKGAMDFGYSFSSGNSQSSLNLGTSAAYKTPSWETASSFDSTFSGQSGASQTNREDAQISFSKFLNRNSFVQGLAGFLHSSQQDLTLRTTLGGGYGRYLKRTTNSNLAWMGGVVYAKESFDTTAGQSSDQNMEAVVGLKYNLVRFNFGELNSQVQAFPGLTDAGRLRATTNASLTIKLRNNFHLAFTFWDDYDSQPPPLARKNELGISTGLGWSF